MKQIKILLGVFILTCILSVNNVNAGKGISFVGITLPSWSGTYVSSNATKQENSYQYSKTVAATDNITGGGRAISARVYGCGTSYVTAPKGSWVQLSDKDQHTTVEGIAYKIQLKAKKSTLAKVTYSGRWALDRSART